MPLHDDIVREISTGRIPKRFNISDLLFDPVDESETKYRIGCGEYRLSSIRSIPNNESFGPNGRIGNTAGKSGRANYEKFADGKFEIRKRRVRPNSRSKISNKVERRFDEADDAVGAICQSFVDYLSNKPFRIYLGNLGWYPDTAAVGWDQRLQNYAWPLRKNPPPSSAKWPSNRKKLHKYSKDLKALISSKNLKSKKARNDAEKIYNNIRDWGNPRGTDRDGAEVIARLERILGTDYPAHNLVDSTLTKLYALAMPDRYVIYDSRVACAITSIAEDIYRGPRIDHFRQEFPNLGHMDYAASSGTRPRGRRIANWPNAYQSWKAQLDANRLCIGIVNCLNANAIDGRSRWKLRDVEAVLFMEGY